jgi:hypothetical protein
LLFSAMERIFCHSIFFLSVVRGNDIILFVKYWKAAFCVEWGD